MYCFIVGVPDPHPSEIRCHVFNNVFQTLSTFEIVEKMVEINRIKPTFLSTRLIPSTYFLEKQNKILLTWIVHCFFCLEKIFCVKFDHFGGFCIYNCTKQSRKPSIFLGKCDKTAGTWSWPKLCTAKQSLLGWFYYISELVRLWYL